MLVYEKNNKLNINFDNEVNENPDLQIGKEDGKTEIVVDGQKNSSIPVPVLPEDVGKAIIVSEDGSYVLAEVGGNGPLVVTFSGTDNDGNSACDKTWAEISAAISAGRNITAYYQGPVLKYLLVYFASNKDMVSTYMNIYDISNPSSDYTKIFCLIDYTGAVRCTVEEVIS